MIQEEGGVDRVGLMTNDSHELFHGEYFEWLRSQVHVPTAKQKQYYLSVLNRLHNREFVWTIPNDDNRLEDGRALRAEWAGGSDHPFQQGVSILEVFVAFSRHLEFQAGGQACYWAWRFIENLGLHRFPDGASNREEREERARMIEDILDTFVWRQYKRDGTGGIFPLAWPEEDQTKVELWYQMHAYLHEMQEP
jgi:hypothetical protein